MKEKNAVVNMALEVTIMRVAGDWSKSIKGYKCFIKDWCRAGLAGQKGEVTIVLADDATLKRLNNQYRGKNKPTNVLSFTGEGQQLGEIVLSYEMIKCEAKRQGKSFLKHTAHLIIHGCLHLLGHDHENERDAEKMEALECSLLAQFGIGDPYEAL